MSTTASSLLRPECVLKWSDDDVEDRQSETCCAGDGGWPFGCVVQAEHSNHRKLRRLRAGVVSVAVEGPLSAGQVGLRALGLELHPAKTKVVYCKDANRRRQSEHTSFDFLGYTFRGRLARGRNGFFVNFLPAISNQAKKAKGQQIRGWHLNRRTGTDLSGIAQAINPQVRGWINYYGVFYHSEFPWRGASTTISFDGSCTNTSHFDTSRVRRIRRWPS